MVDDHVKGKTHVGRTGPHRVKGEKAHLECPRQCIGMMQGPIQDRFAVAGFADHIIGRGRGRFNPVAFGVNHVELVFLVVFQLPPDDGIEVEPNVRIAQCLTVFLRHAAHFVLVPKLCLGTSG